jgi:hypothetical protein
MICRQSFLKGSDEMKLANDKRTILAFLNVSDEDEYCDNGSVTLGWNETQELSFGV